jgi:hypothetical protein
VALCGVAVKENHASMLLMRRSIFLKSLLVGFIVAAIAAIDAWLRNRNVTDALVPIGAIVGFYALLAFVIASIVSALLLIVYARKPTYKTRRAIFIVLLVAALALFFFGFI